MNDTSGEWNPYAYPASPRPSAPPPSPAPSPYPGAYAPYGQYAPYAPYPQTPPPPRPRGGRIALVATVVVLALVAAGGVVVAVRHSQQQTAVVNAELAASRAKIMAELPRLEAWIADDRGLVFKDPVVPEVLSDHDFVAALRDGGEAAAAPSPLPGDTVDPDDIGTTFAAMGLVDSADDFYSSDDAATAAGVDGFYDHQTKRLVVRGTTWTPSMEYVLVHELTHALQDQNFDLAAFEHGERTDDESILTTTAVVEGDAERVADDYYDQQTTQWQDSVDAVQGSGAGSSAPIVDVYEGAPYAFGEHFIQGLFGIRGNFAVDAAFHTAPETSAQLVHPDKWYAGVLPVPMPAVQPPVAPSGDLADRGVLGQLGLWSIGAALADRPDPRAATQLDGWRGDRYVSTSDDDGMSCFVDVVQFSTEATRTTAVAYLGHWIQHERITSTAEGKTGLRLSSCQDAP